MNWAASDTRSNILGGTLAVIASVILFFYVTVSFLHFATIHGAPHSFEDYVHFTAQTSFDITTGHPLGRIWQDRVLAPYTIKALSLALKGLPLGPLDYYGVAYVCFQIVTVAVVAFLCWRLGRKYGDNDGSALLALVLFIVCFALLLSPPLLYSWDFVDLIIFCVFLDFVLSGVSLPWFVGLFSIAIWNRETANFVALWLIVDPLIRLVYGRRYKLPNNTLEWHRILVGIACIAVGLVVSELLKRYLLVEEWAPKVIPDSVAGQSYNFVLLQNFDFLMRPLSNFRFWIVIPFLTVALSFGAKFVRLNPYRNLGIYLVEIAMLVALLSFGLLDELRDSLIFIPFLVTFATFVSASKHRKALTN